MKLLQYSVPFLSIGAYVPLILPEYEPKEKSSMVIRIASAVLTLAGLLALISGVLFWTGTAVNLIALHMLLGFLAVGALWVIGAAQAFAPRGSWVIAACALIVGAVMIVLGMMQSSLLPGEYHWIIQVIHLALGLLTIGIGHMAAARSHRHRVGKT